MSGRAFDRAKRDGQHYTPPALAKFLAERAAIRLPRDRPLRVLDPACGDGELLIAATAALTAAGRTVAELVGCELDPDAAAASRARIAATTGSRVHVGNFLDLAEDGHALGAFDLVITNPPYVRTQVLGAELSNALARRFGLGGRVDLTHAFVALSAELLAPQGVLALLCSNRFLSTRAGENVRRILADGFACQEIHDLGDTRLFKAAVLPAVVIAVSDAEKSGTDRNPDPAFVRVYTSADGAASQTFPSIFEALASSSQPRTVSVGGTSYAVEHGTLARGNPGAPWTLRTRESENWLSRMKEGTWRTIGELARTRVGIKTTADAVFIRADWDDLPDAIRPEEHVLRPLLTHENVRAWHVTQPRADPAARARVLYPYDMGQRRRTLLDSAGHPRAMAYLRQHEDRLKARRYVVDSGREWYEIWVPQRPALWSAPKIVFPDISAEARFAIDTSGAIVNGDCYWISVAELPDEDLAHLMLAVANSATGLRFYDTVCGNRLYAGRRRWITQYVERLPLPRPDTPAARRAVRLARALCAAPDPDAHAALSRELDSAVDDAFAPNF